MLEPHDEVVRVPHDDHVAVGVRERPGAVGQARSTHGCRHRAPIFANQIHNFTPRLFKALNYPKVILPTHWDNFEKPYSEGPQDLRAIFGDPANLDLWVKEAKQVSPKSKIVVMKFFEAYAA